MQDQSLVRTRFGAITIVMRVVFVLGLLLVLGRVAQLQLAPSEELKGFISPRTTTSTLEAPRGDLLDRRGRVIATTRIGSRVIVDPTLVERNLDQTIVALAEATGEDPGTLGARIISRVMENKDRAKQRAVFDARAARGEAQPLGADGKPESAPRLIRYLPVGGVLDFDTGERVKELKLSGVSVERIPVRVGAADTLVGPIVGKVGTRDRSTERYGMLGAEASFDSTLAGADGGLSYVKDAWDDPMWVEHGAWIEEQRGGDVRLSIDLEIQRIVLEELEWGAEQADSSGARAVVINPHTGEVLAIADVMREVEGLEEFPWYDPESGEPPARLSDVSELPRYRVLAPDPMRDVEPSLGRSRSVRDLYEPGSTFKPFAWALAKTQGLLPDDEIIEVEYGQMRTDYGRMLTDVTPRDRLSWDDVLRYSSNVGMGIATSRTSEKDLRETILSLGFGERTGIGIMGEQSGIVTSDQDWNHWTQTSVGMGYEVAVTPVQMVRAFSVFAREGEMAGTLPELRLSAAGLDNRTGLTKDEIYVTRVFSPEAAARVREPLRSVAERMDNNNCAVNGAPKPTYSMFGKSGTSTITCIPPEGKRRPYGATGYFEKQYTSSFLVAAPAEKPEIVVLVVIDDPGPDTVKVRHHFGSWVAGPVVRRIVERVLPYLGVEPDLVEKADVPRT